MSRSIRHIPALFLWTSAIVVLLCLEATNSVYADERLAGSARNPMLDVTVEHAVLQLSMKPGITTSTHISVVPLNFPVNAQLTYTWKQVQDALSPTAAQMDKGKRIRFSSTTSPLVAVSFPDWGVYEVRVKVTDARHKISVSKNTWISVWDSRSHLVVNGKADPLGVAPGINPPSSVRTLTPDPGPFAHPRIYCSYMDWPEIHKRCTSGILAGKAFKILQQEAAKGIDSPHSAFGKFTTELEAYANSQYAGDAPDLTMGIPAEIKNGKSDWGNARGNLNKFYDQLRNACFVAWVQNDPSLSHIKVTAEDQSRFRRLAKVVAAVSRLHLQNCWDSKTGVFKKDYPLYIDGLEIIGDRLGHFANLALAYDFIASWMTSGEQREARNLLFAVSVGRTTGARSLYTQINGVTLNHGVERGLQQNGDFMNIEEERVIIPLCIAGEDSQVDPKIVQTFTSLPRPDDFMKSGKVFPYDWIQMADYDSGRDHPTSKPYPIGSTWPFARKVEVDNLQRAIWWNDDAYVSPWGFQLNKEAYYGFSALGVWPSAVAYAKHGAENQYITNFYYHTAIHLIYNYSVGAVTRKSDHYKSNVYIYDHHDGGGDYRQTHVLLMKYMYPDDPLVDYIYSVNADDFENQVFNPFNTALFGLDPGINGKPTAHPAMAKQKALPLTKLDPQNGLVVVRSGWKDTDAMLYFDEGWLQTGHMHAEKTISPSTLLAGRGASRRGTTLSKAITSPWFRFRIPRTPTTPTPRGTSAKAPALSLLVQAGQNHSQRLPVN